MMCTNILQMMGKSWHLGVRGKVLLEVKSNFRKHVPMHEVTYIGVTHWQVVFGFFLTT